MVMTGVPCGLDFVEKMCALKNWDMTVMEMMMMMMMEMMTWPMEIDFFGSRASLISRARKL